MKVKPEQRPRYFPKLTRNREDAALDGAKHFIGKPCKFGHTRRDVKYGNCVVCKRDRGHKRHTTNNSSKMLEIDHYIESQDFFLDQYYHLEP